MRKYLLVALLLTASAAACASDKTPAKVAREDMLELQIVSMQLEAIQRAANEAAAGPLARRGEIMKRYGLDWMKLGPEGSEQHVAQDGTITRKAPAAAPAQKGKK